MENRGVLVTGANGFVGGNLVSYLKEKYRVNCLVRDRQYRPENARTFYFDSYDDPAVEEAVRDSGAIVHCAAMLHGRPGPMRNANIGFTKRLVELAGTHGIGQFLFLSTENVNHELYDTYTATKREAEQAVRGFPNHTILRPTVIYGPGDTKYVSRLIGIAERYPVIPVLGSGSNRFQFLWIEDLVRVTAGALKMMIYGTHTVAGPESITYNDFMERLLRHLGISKSIVRVPIFVLKPICGLLELFSKRPALTRTQLKNLDKDREYDIERTAKLFNYTPTPIDEGLKRLIRVGTSDE